MEYAWLLLLIPAFALCVFAFIAFSTASKGGAQHVSGHIKPPPELRGLPRYNESLAELIGFETVTGAPDEEFARLRAYLCGRFPLSHAEMAHELISGGSSVYRWRGTGSGDPILLCAHCDVAPAGPGWTSDPFEGAVGNGYVSGRGAADCKGVLAAIFEACEDMIAHGYAPERDVYIAIGHDEENGGESGAKVMAKLFHDMGVRFSLVLDEGEPVTTESPWTGRPAANLAVAEKGVLNLRLSAVSTGGRASAPPCGPNAVDRLAEALRRIGRYNFPTRVTPALKGFLASVAPTQSFLRRMAFYSPSACSVSLAASFRKKPWANALIRTTSVSTGIRTGAALNALPRQASATVSFGVLQGDRCSEILRAVELLTRGLGISVETLYACDPSGVTSSGGRAYADVAGAVRSVFGDIAVYPSILTAGSDGWKYSRSSDSIVSFTPFCLTPDDAGRVHGADERIPDDAMAYAVAFYKRIIRSAGLRSGRNGGDPAGNNRKDRQ